MEIQFKKFLQLFVPICLRKSIMLALFGAIGVVLQRIKEKYDAIRQQQLYKLTHTGQVAVLINVLNEYFGLTRADGFEIVDSVPREYVLVYSEESENFDKTAIAYDENSETQTLLFNENSIGEEIYPYVLFVPKSIYDDDNSLNIVKTIVRQYRLPGRRCVINVKE